MWEVRADMVILGNTYVRFDCCCGELHIVGLASGGTGYHST
jgi:hypothetical protein